MIETPPRPSGRLLWAKRAVALLLSLAFTEALLRGGFMLWAYFGSAPGFGIQPPILARLFYAYWGGRYSMLAVNSDLTVADAHRGYRLAPGLRNRDVSGEPVSTNSRGMRGVREYDLPKPASGVRVVALGDSFTFGEGVPDDASWPAQLESAVPGMEVLNLGERGYAHDQMYFALLDDGLHLEPDAVILGFYENDVWRDTLVFYSYEKPRFSSGPAGWYIENVPIPSPREVRDYYLLLPLVYALPRALVERLAISTTGVSGGEERAAEILRQTQILADEAGARFLIVNLPDLNQPQPNRADHPGIPPPPPGVFYDYCATTGAECVDPWRLFWETAGTTDAAEIRARYLRPNDMHYSRAGYGIVAEALRRHIVERPIARAIPKSSGSPPPSRPPH